MKSYTEITYKFYDQEEPITFTILTYIVNMWIEERTPINTLRRLGYVINFREFQQ